MFVTLLMACTTTAAPEPQDASAASERAERVRNVDAPQMSDTRRAALELARKLEALAAADDPRLKKEEPAIRSLSERLDAPVPRREPVPAAEPAAAAERADAAEFEGGQSIFHAVHIASFRNMDLARAGWREYQGRRELSGYEARAEQVRLDSGIWYRVKAGPIDTVTQADALCRALKASGEWCAVTDFNGAEL